MTKVQKSNFKFKRRRINPGWEDGLYPLPIRSCLIRHKSDRIEVVKTVPKWITDMTYDEVDVSTGEVTEGLIYETNDFKKSNGRKIKQLDRFCDHYQPLYRKREVSLLFFTFTQANQALVHWSRMLDVARIRFKRAGTPVRGYIWTGEVSLASGSPHWHYHLCVAVDRVNWTEIPAYAKMESVWGRRTDVEFVKKNVRHYMAKYFAKHQSRVCYKRSYGCSKNFM